MCINLYTMNKSTAKKTFCPGEISILANRLVLPRHPKHLVSIATFPETNGFDVVVSRLQGADVDTSRWLHWKLGKLLETSRNLLAGSSWDAH